MRAKVVTRPRPLGSRETRSRLRAIGGTLAAVAPHVLGKILGKSKKVKGNEDLTLSKTGKIQEGDKIGGRNIGATTTRG